MPVRFTTPSLGGQSGQEVRPHEWQAGVAFRKLSADKWFVGREIRDDKAPFGKPLSLDISSMDFTFRYGVTRRASVGLTLPFSRGVQTRFYADGQSHTVTAQGLGDVSLMGTMWFADPINVPRRNVALGAGIKAPTGNNHAADDFFTSTGITRAVVDQSIQLGDGGLGIIVQSQGFQQLGERAFVFAAGSYLVSPKGKTDVQFVKSDGTGSGMFLSVPDVYYAKAGVAYALWPARQLSASFGARVDGIPIRDVVGGGDDGFRRPGYSLFADPGFSIAVGAGTLTLNAPVRVGQNFKPDLTAGHPVGGDLADFLLFATYTVRF
jgi:hypothetical protein